MIKKASYVDQIELKPWPVVLLRIGLVYADDGVVQTDVPTRWHRTSFRRDTDVEAHMATVNADLVSRGEAPISDDEIQRIKRAVDFHMLEFPEVE